MDQRDGVIGLVLAALMAWLLPAVVRTLSTEETPQTRIAARDDPDAGSGALYQWESATGDVGSDGWVLAPDGSLLYPVPGWRGLLLGHPLDPNTATATDLEALPGIGPRTAAAVIAHRNEAEPFATVDDLTRVQGIGPSIVSSLRPLLQIPRAPGSR